MMIHASQYYVLADLLLHIHNIGMLKFDEDVVDTNSEGNTWDKMYSCPLYSHQLQRVDVSDDDRNSNLSTHNNKNNSGNDSPGNYGDDAIVIVVPSSTPLMKVMLTSSVGTYIDKIQTLRFEVKKEFWYAQVTMIIQSNNIIKLEIHTTVISTPVGNDDENVESTEKEKRVIKEVGVMMRMM